MIRRRRAGVTLLGVALALLALPLAAQPASAHDSLLSAAPGDGETVTSLQEIVLTYSGDPIGQQGANLVELRGPDGRYYETACPALAGPDVTTPVTPGPAGTYTVIWRIVSSDGHPVSGEYTFDYAPPAGATATPGAASPGASSPACAPAGAATPAPAAPSDGGGAAGLWLGIGIGGAAVVVVAVVAWLLVRRSPGDDA